MLCEHRGGARLAVARFRAGRPPRVRIALLHAPRRFGIEAFAERRELPPQPDHRLGGLCGRRLGGLRPRPQRRQFLGNVNRTGWGRRIVRSPVVHGHLGANALQIGGQRTHLGGAVSQTPALVGQLAHRPLAFAGQPFVERLLLAKAFGDLLGLAFHLAQPGELGLDSRHFGLQLGQPGAERDHLFGRRPIIRPRPVVIGRLFQRSNGIADRVAPAIVS